MTTSTDRRPAGSLTTRLSARARNALSPEQRTAFRRATDAWVGPIGSVKGAAVDDAIALTYDDGPGPGTGPILDVLAERGASATFFVLVERVEEHPDLVRRIVAEGHEVGLHGLDHTRLTTLSHQAARERIASGKHRVEDLTGRPVRWFRPPYGSQTPSTFLAARRCGLQVAVWTCDAEDWIDRDPARIADLGLERLTPGGVLLLHDGFENDPAAPLPEPRFDRARATSLLLDGLAARQQRAVSLGRLVAEGRTVRTAWYRS